MTFLAVTLLLVFFSCSADSELVRNPKSPVLRYNDNGYLESSISSRIVGGTPAVVGEFKGKISIQQAASYPTYVYHFCGGTLIHASHVLTAAHCVTRESGSVIEPSFFMLVGDELYINYISSTRQARTASHVFVHPQYSISGILNDIALIRTSSPFIVTSTFSTVPRIQYSPSAGTSCSVAGWGSIYYVNNGPASAILLRINATVIDKTICNSDASYEGFVKDGMFCAGNMAGGYDACQGDSGGGLICGNSVAGVVSWGVECALPNFPGVYTDVAVYNNWIDEKIYWSGQPEDVPTPTTIGTGTGAPTRTTVGTNPNQSTVSVISFNLFSACMLVLLISRQ